MGDADFFFSPNLIAIQNTSRRTATARAREQVDSLVLSQSKLDMGITALYLHAVLELERK